MKPDDILIERFNSGTCTPAEAKLVMDWFMSEEQDAWEEETQGQYPSHYEAKMLSVIRADTFGTKRVHLWWKIVAAASVLLLFSLSLQKQSTQIQAPAIVSNWINITAAAKTNIRLKDGSAILLESGSSLRYDSTACRTVYLEGQAQFTVSANEQRPFTVKTKGFSTIALGTSFMVSAQKDFHVKLFSGKVLIRNSKQKDQYLLPGEQLAYNDITGKELVSRFVKKEEKVIKQRQTISIYDDSMVFDNAPLKEVLELFKEKYHITITYDEQNIAGVYFSGKVLSADPIELILKTITRINNLTLTSREGTYIIL
jgi:transmembrane sensor